MLSKTNKILFIILLFNIIFMITIGIRYKIVKREYENYIRFFQEIEEYEVK